MPPAQFVNESERHPLPNGHHPAVENAQSSYIPGEFSPHEVEAANTLLFIRWGGFERLRAQQAWLEANQLPTTTWSAAVQATGGETAHDEAAGEGAVAADNTTEDQQQQAPQQQAPHNEAPHQKELQQELQQGQGQVQGREQDQEQQEPHEFRRTGEDDGAIESYTFSVSANSGSRRPLPSYKPQPRPKPQPKRKRGRDEVKKEGEMEEDEEGAEPKKRANTQRGKPKEKKETEWKCSECGRENFAREDHLQRHVKNVHGIMTESGERGFVKFKCDICQDGVSRRDNLRTHRNTLHPEAGPAPEPRCVLESQDGRYLCEWDPTSPANSTANSAATSSANSTATSTTRGIARMARPGRTEPESGPSGATSPILGGFHAINR